MATLDKNLDLDFNENLFEGISKKSRQERLEILKKSGLLNSDEVDYLAKGGMKDFSLGEKFIENVIGYFQLPLGIATNFRVNNKDYIVPMAVEETSIVAAASKTAKWVRKNGFATAKVIGHEIIGQIQFAKLRNPILWLEQIEINKESWLKQINQDVASSMVLRGGGATSIVTRTITRPDGLQMGIVHLHMNAKDAMGANIINQACEYLKPFLELVTKETVTMCILSNLVDTKLTEATVVIENIEEDLAYKIEEASLFSQIDPYRAATNNKGVLNGIDPILIATGNDWRAVEAGIHAYAAQQGQYRSITSWKKDGKNLVGQFLAPVIVGTVGGVTSLHPTAALSLKLMKVESADELSQVIATVGLVQNLGALKALTTVGIIEGHMRLHIKNLSLGAGASESEMPFLQKKLEQILSIKKRISLTQAVEALKELRAQL